MIKSIKLKDARELIHQNKLVGKFIYVDCVRDPSYYEGNVDEYMEIIFRENNDDQLYSFWYYNSDDPDLGITIDTVQKFDSFINDDDNLDVEITPVKKINKQYIGDDSND